MSRTRKDRPVWVKLNDRKTPRIAEHNHNLFGKKGLYGFGEPKEYAYLDYCTIDKPQEAVVHIKEQSPCYYYAAIPKIFYAKYGGAHKEALHLYYWKPVRGEERRKLHNLKKEYRAAGEIGDDTFITDKTRRSPYKGGYWD